VVLVVLLVVAKHRLLVQNLHINIYLGLGSYQLTIIEWNSGVECKGNSRVVKKSLSRVANMNREGLRDSEFNLLEGVDRW